MATVADQFQAMYLAACQEKQTKANEEADKFIAGLYNHLIEAATSGKYEYWVTFDTETVCSAIDRKLMAMGFEVLYFHPGRLHYFRDSKYFSNGRFNKIPQYILHNNRMYLMCIRWPKPKRWWQFWK